MKYLLTIFLTVFALTGCGVEMWEAEIHRYRYTAVIDGPVSNENWQNSFSKLERTGRPYVKYPHWSFMNGTKLIEPELHIHTASAFGDKACLNKIDALARLSDEEGWRVFYSVCYQTGYLGW
jgi:hypothetical protein